MSKNTTGERFNICQLGDVEPVRCPCGSTRRAFLDDPDQIASMHVVTTSGEGKLHYHKKMTEIYYFLEGDGHIELDGEKFPAKPGTSVMIKPGCRHRAVGNFKFINVPIPAFDESDEWFD